MAADVYWLQRANDSIFPFERIMLGDGTGGRCLQRVTPPCSSRAPRAAGDVVSGLRVSAQCVCQPDVGGVGWNASGPRYTMQQLATIAGLRPRLAATPECGMDYPGRLARAESSHRRHHGKAVALRRKGFAQLRPRTRAVTLHSPKELSRKLSRRPETPQLLKFEFATLAPH